MCAEYEGIHGFVCGSKLYEFDGWFFEDSYSGPWPLKKDGELKARAGRKFWKMYNKFRELPLKEQKKCRVGGGCISF